MLPRVLGAPEGAEETPGCPVRIAYTTARNYDIHNFAFSNSLSEKKTFSYINTTFVRIINYIVKLFGNENSECDF